MTGRATYSSVPYKTGGSLDYLDTSDAPVRGATVQLIDASGTAVATTKSDAQGHYTLQVASASTPTKLRVLAELKGPKHHFTVRDNTDGGALYAMESPGFTPRELITTTQNIHAPSGWGGSSYSAARVAAPFAILDTAYLAQMKIHGIAPDTTLKPLSLYWSPNNVPSPGDRSLGQIGSSFFTITPLGEAAVFLLGAQDTDTDEYDTPVVAHEIGHYLQHAVSRDDSVGGQHSGDQLLDMRVAFSEGFGNAWSSMVRDNPTYFDSKGPQQAGGFAFSVAVVPFTKGWYAESSVEYLLWQHYQDPGIGLGGVYTALTSLRHAPTFSSIFSFHDALRIARPAVASGITTLAATVGIHGIDSRGTGESNSGGIAGALPVYQTHTAGFGSAQTYCVTSAAGTANKLGNYVYASFNTSGTHAITVTVMRSASTTQTTDPDMTLITADGQKMVAQGEAVDIEALSAVTLPPGNHVFAINDYAMTATSGSRCFDVTINF